MKSIVTAVELTEARERVVAAEAELEAARAAFEAKQIARRYYAVDHAVKMAAAARLNLHLLERRAS